MGDFVLSAVVVSVNQPSRAAKWFSEPWRVLGVGTQPVVMVFHYNISTHTKILADEKQMIKVVVSRDFGIFYSIMNPTHPMAPDKQAKMV